MCTVANNQIVCNYSSRKFRFDSQEQQNSKMFKNETNAEKLYEEKPLPEQFES